MLRRQALLIYVTAKFLVDDYMREDLDYLDYLEETIPTRSDEELIDILTASPGARDQTAVDFALEELRGRGFKVAQTDSQFAVLSPAGDERIIQRRSVTAEGGGDARSSYAQGGAAHAEVPVGVSGWLALLIVDLVILSPLYFLLILYLFGFGVSVIKYYPLLGSLLLLGRVTGLIITGFSVYYGILLYRVVPHAVRSTKRFLVIGSVCVSLISMLIYLVATSSEVEIIQQAASAIPPQIIGSWIGCAVWYMYLSLSKRVAVTYGLKAERGL